MKTIETLKGEIQLFNGKKIVGGFIQIKPIKRPPKGIDTYPLPPTPPKP